MTIDQRRPLYNRHAPPQRKLRTSLFFACIRSPTPNNNSTSLISLAMWGNRNSDTGHWFLRGVQSAIFYYVSCAPCIDARYKKRRRREAKAAEAQVVDTEPGFVRQPMAFQTNEQWTEEIILGPGPPKQWKGDPILLKYRKNKHPTPPSTPTSGAPSSDAPNKPPLERRFSSAIGNVKESIRNSLHPETLKWNWKRYDRDDEILRGLGDKMTNMGDKMTNMGDKVTRIWDRVTSGSHQEEVLSGRKRAHTNESDQYDYTRGHFPAINNLHPPVVSQLPANKADAAWMMLPPPSAAVMAGRERPTQEMAYRVPLCIIGRPPKENVPPEELRSEMPRHVSDITWEAYNASEDTEDERPPNPRHQSEPIPVLRPPPKASLSSDLFVPKARAIAALDGIPMDLFTKADLSSSGTVTPKSRPSSWQFHYIIPSQ